MIAIVAEAFGYGPGSKAHAIIQRLDAANCLCIGSGTSSEYLEAHGYRCLLYEEPPAPDRLRAELDDHAVTCAVVVLDVLWAERLLDAGAQVFYVDSLGFMWGPDHVRDHPSLGTRVTYICQDVLGAYDSLKAHGISHLQRVGAIVDLVADSALCPYDYVVNLGGMFTGANDKAAVHYLAWVGSLVTDLARVRGGRWVILSSKRGVAYLKESYPSLDCECLRHSSALAAMRSALTVLTSPGLTTLLELSALSAPVQPLPPQNYSQCCIVQDCLKHGYVDGGLWSLLASEFDLERGLPETQGIALAEERMIAFARRHSTPLALYLTEGMPSRIRLTDDFTGATRTAEIVRSACLA